VRLCATTLPTRVRSPRRGQRARVAVPGKDTVFVMTPKDQRELGPPRISLPRGAVGDSGEIDWDCPCIRSMTEGPCGQMFKNAFECFVRSETTPKVCGATRRATRE
jgi:hypothetical protein